MSPVRPGTTPATAPATVRAVRHGDVEPLLGRLAGVLDALYPEGARHLAASLDAAVHNTPVRATAAVGAAAGVPCHADVTVDRAGLPVSVLVTRGKPGGTKIATLWVAPEHRRSGHGRELVRRVVAARADQRLYLTCAEPSAAAVAALLTPFGFTRQTTCRDRYGPGRDEVVFTRPPDPDPPVRALSLTRPWGAAILHGGKNIENRSWRRRWRGLVVVHSARSVTDVAGQFCRARRLPQPPSAQACPTGYIGVARLVGIDCHFDECGGACSPWAMPGSWHWHLTDTVPFARPVPGPGQVGLWTPPDDVITLARQAAGLHTPTKGEPHAGR